MKSTCAALTSNQENQPARRIAFLALGLALVTLASSGCTALPLSEQVPQTATVINRHVAGADDGLPGEYTPGANPRKIICQSREEAAQLGHSLTLGTSASLLLTSGTHSMAPLIKGRAYVVVQKRSYDAIAKGALLVYMGRPDANKPDRTCMLHRAVMHDSGGWLMCGDNNRWAESWDRVTPTSYMGMVTAILEFPQS